ncbi:hypothetical protein MiSe_94980 [Microseira wollei NIES-4236]|uniref:Uncharacterized protein n=1 Tax=Microseira wollei NIES-4236 TaxID=2530354 RepID=A0AAV3XU92_9CYAN|nr:hypothetical protein MiSe_94980 [Microseira wollei NIES-4236]
MILIWGEQEFVNVTAIPSPLLPPQETRVSPWDTWEFRGLWNQHRLISQGFPLITCRCRTQCRGNSMPDN